MNGSLCSTAVACALLLAAPVTIAQTSGGLTVSTHVSSTIGLNGVDRSTPTSAPSGPLLTSDFITQSVYNGPSGHTWAQASASADWQPGAVKVSSTARIDGLCLSLGNGGCSGPGTSQAGATASAGTLTLTDPGVTVPTLVHNNLSLSGIVQRAATFNSAYTEAQYINGTIPNATAGFAYRIQQMVYNADAGRDVFQQLASGTVNISSRYDGSLSVTSTGFLQSPTWNGAPLILTTPDYTLMPGKEISVQFSANVDTGLLYSLRTDDVLLSSLIFGNTFRFSSDAGSPAFAAATSIDIPALGISGGVYAAPVPEPTSALLLLSGLTLLITRRRLGRVMPGDFLTGRTYSPKR